MEAHSRPTQLKAKQQTLLQTIGELGSANESKEEALAFLKADLRHVAERLDEAQSAAESEKQRRMRLQALLDEQTREFGELKREHARAQATHAETLRALSDDNSALRTELESTRAALDECRQEIELAATHQEVSRVKRRRLQAITAQVAQSLSQTTPSTTTATATSTTATSTTTTRATPRSAAKRGDAADPTSYAERVRAMLDSFVDDARPDERRRRDDVAHNHIASDHELDDDSEFDVGDDDDDDVGDDDDNDDESIQVIDDD